MKLVGGKEKRERFFEFRICKVEGRGPAHRFVGNDGRACRLSQNKKDVGDALVAEIHAFQHLGGQGEEYYR